MMQKCLVMAIVFGMALTLSVRAEDEAVNNEIDRLKQRVEELEKKQENDEETFGNLSEIAKCVSFGGVLSGAYQYEWVNGPPDIDDQGRGALSFQPEVSITPTENDDGNNFNFFGTQLM